MKSYGLSIFIFLIFTLILSFDVLAGDTYAIPYETTEYLGNPTSDNVTKLHDPYYGGNESMRVFEVTSSIEPKELAEYWDKHPDKDIWQRLYVCDERFLKYKKKSNYFKAVELSQTFPESDRICKCIESRSDSFSNRKYDLGAGYKMGNTTFALLTSLKVFPNIETARTYKDITKITTFKHKEYSGTNTRTYKTTIHYEFCGDGIRQNNEKCDDGNLNGTPGYCNDSCYKILRNVKKNSLSKSKCSKDDIKKLIEKGFSVQEALEMCDQKK